MLLSNPQRRKLFRSLASTVAAIAYPRSAAAAARLADSRELPGIDDRQHTVTYPRLRSAAAQLSLEGATISPDILSARTLGYRDPHDGGAALYLRRFAEPPHPGKARSTDGAWWEIAASRLNFHQFGAYGDGTRDDHQAIADCAAAAVYLNRAEVHALPNKRYFVGTGIPPKWNLVWDLHGSAIFSDRHIYLFQDEIALEPVATVSADIVAPTDTIPLTTTNGINVGDWLGLRLGDNSWDAVEPYYAIAARVMAIAANAVQLDHVIQRSITLSGASPHNKIAYKLHGNTHDVTIRNGIFQCDQTLPGVEGGTRITFGRNLTFESIHGNPAGVGDMGTGLIGLLQFCNNIRVSHCTLLSNRNTRKQASHGRMLNFSNCLDVLVENPRASNLQSSFAFVESYSQNVIIRDAVLQYKQSISGGHSFGIIGYVQNSSGTIANPTITTDYIHQDFIGDGGAQDGTSRAPNITGTLTWRGPLPHGVAPIGDTNCVLDYANGPDFVVVDLSAAQSDSHMIRITPDMRLDIAFSGPLKELLLFASHHTDATQLTMYLGFDATSGANISSAIQPGHLVNIGKRGLINNTGNSFLGISRLRSRARLHIATSSTLADNGAFVLVRGTCATVLVDAAHPILPLPLSDEVAIRMLHPYSASHS